MLCGPGPAAQADDEREHPAPTFEFQSENDAFVRGKGTDRWFTNGLRLTLTYGPSEWAETERFLRTVGNSLSLLSNAQGGRVISFTLGQNIYTPEHIDVATPQPFDRPWGGWLYGGVSLQEYPDDKREELRSTELKVGVVGPPSLAEQAQKLVHNAFGLRRPIGWDNQLKTVPGVELSQIRMFRVERDTRQERFLSFQYGAGAIVGDIRTMATVNVGAVLGIFRPNESPPLFMSNEGDFVVHDFGDRGYHPYPYLFAMASATAVAYNRLLSGQAAGGDAAISVRPFVGAVQVGLAWHPTRHSKLVYAVSARTPEFDSAHRFTGGLNQRWGSLTFQCECW